VWVCVQCRETATRVWDRGDPGDLIAMVVYYRLAKSTQETQALEARAQPGHNDG
jgi:hypothetical protein